MDWLCPKAIPLWTLLPGQHFLDLKDDLSA
jgi:hypothetical protein